MPASMVARGMSSALYRYLQGSVAIAAIVACRRAGLFACLTQSKRLPFATLVERLAANASYLRVALKLLQSMGWVSWSSQQDVYELIDKARLAASIPTDIEELLSLTFEANLAAGGKSVRSLLPWLQLSIDHWNTSALELAECLDGLLIVPLLGHLQRSGHLKEPLFSGLSEPIKEALTSLFLAKQWCENKHGSLQVTAAGGQILEPGDILLAARCYDRIVRQVHALLLGEHERISHSDAHAMTSGVAAAENTSDNRIWRAGDFEHIESLVLPMFDRLPFDQQPHCIVEVGGDGDALLKLLHESIVEKSARGTVLDRYPLRVVRIDAAPSDLPAALEAAGITDRRGIVYLQVFADHDGAHLTSAEPESVGARGIRDPDESGVDRQGCEIAAYELDRHLIERMRQWAAVVSEHGLIAVERHAIEPEVEQRDGDSASACFDPYHAFSRRLSVAAARYVMAAAAAGLFPEPGPCRTWPRAQRRAAVSFARFERKPHSVRHAREADVEALVTLEKRCWQAGTRATAKVIRGRIARYPDGQLVLEINGELKGCIYSQRIASVESLYGATAETVSKQHTAAGSVVQLLALNVSPEVQDQQLGDQLLEFMLQRCALLGDVHTVVGVTRCKDYAKHRSLALQDYIHSRNGRGDLTDTILRLHESHGAAIRRLMPAYRPADRENDGAGVLVEYDLRVRRPRTAMAQTGDVHSQMPFMAAHDQAAIDDFLTRTIGGLIAWPAGDSIPKDRPLMELGLNSADLTELAASINHEFRMPLAPLFFFEHNTLEKILASLTTVLSQSPPSDPTLPKPGIAAAVATVEDVGEGERRSMSSVPSAPSTGIAVIGAACRLSNDIQTPQQLWHLLAQGAEAIGCMPDDRWRWPRDIDPRGTHTGIDRGGFLSDIACFDAAFFRVSPHEAQLMDPQQRILLELSWHCLEDAGYAPASLAGSKTGVYIGASGSDYRLCIERARAPIEGHSGLATSLALLPNRISYFYDLRGPSIQIDTACSSSLVALHEAMQSLSMKRCTQALVAGINVMCDPATTVAYYRAGMLSKDGRCKTFDAAANGYVRAEGAVMLMLKPLQDAQRARDNIYAVLKGSAVNHGGQAGGVTVPNPQAQAELLIEAYQTAGIDIQTLGYLEAHGTGTALGDPLEVRGLSLAYSHLSTQRTRANAKCGIGSLKTNLGHLEAAAGIAGVLKLLLCMEHKALPASLHLSSLNPQIDMANSPFHVVQATSPWQRLGEEPRRAGVSSFGSGGTNAHVILEEYCPIATAPSGALRIGAQTPALIVLSAKSEPSLREQAVRLLTHIRDGEYTDEDLLHIAYTLQIGRGELAHRLAFATTSLTQLQELIANYLDRTASSDVSAHCYHGEVRKYADALAPFQKDEDASELLQVWAEKGKYEKLLQLWVRGCSVDWSRLYLEGARYGALTPRRIRLPLYPFEKQRYWIGESGEAVAAPHERDAAPAALPVRPLTAQIQATDDIGGAVLLAPLWEVWAVDPAPITPERMARVLVIGGTPAQQRALCDRYERASVFEVNEGDSVERLAERLREDDFAGHIFWLAPQNEAAVPDALHEDAVIDAQHRGVLSCFRLIKALLELGYGSKELAWTLITWQTATVDRLDAIDPTHASVHGFIGSAAKEHAHWRVRLIDLSLEGTWPLDALLSLPSDRQGDAYAYRRGEWYRQKLLTCDVSTQGAAPYRPGGVYVVIGGAGGIGEVFSQFLIEHYQAQLVWIGRRELDAHIRGKIDRLAALGRPPIYIQADATDRDALEAAYQQIKASYTQVNGIVHSAIALADKTIANMDEQRFRATLAAKVDITVRLAQVFARESPDFVLFFSSILSFLKAPGQSNYAAGCTFADAYASALATRWSCPVKVMNWGYWGSVGAVASQTYRDRMAQQGIGSIEPDAGMAALDRLMRSSFDQLALLQVSRADTLCSLACDERVWQLPAHIARVDSTLLVARMSETLEATGVAALRAISSALPEDLLANLLRAQLYTLDQGMAVGRMLEPRYRTQWQQSMGVRALYDGWLAHSVHLLSAREGNGTDSLQAGPQEEGATLWHRWEEGKRHTSANSGACAHVRLVETTLRALPEILTGACPATDVLFPQGSLELVEGVYRGNPLADYFNELLACALVAYIEARLQYEPTARLRIIEIGAGTGATTASILERLGPYSKSIEEYCYTDVSRAFLAHAQRQFSGRYPYLNCRIFDVEKPLAKQSFAIGHYDVVVATNVLHATQSIRETLRNTKACLKRHGILLLNELSRNDLFYHLTFGLLEGWWRCKDAALRIPGSPVLAPEQWRRVLQLEGFDHTQVHEPAAGRLGQQIVVAQSDGWVRQKSARIEPADRPSQPNDAKLRSIRPADAFSSVQAAPNAHDTLERVRQILAQMLGIAVDTIESDTDLAEYGVDSILGTKILYEIEQAFSTPLPAGTLLEHRTVRELSTRLHHTMGNGTSHRELTSMQAPRVPDRVEAAAATQVASAAPILQSLEAFRSGGMRIEQIEALLNRERLNGVAS